MFARLTAVLFASILTVAIAAGCGGGGGGSDSSQAASGGEATGGSSSSKEVFIKEAAAACRRQRALVLRAMGAYLKKHEGRGVPDGALTANLLKAVFVPAVEVELREIRRLDAPEEDAAEIEAILAAEKEAIGEVRKLKTAKSIDEFGEYFTVADAELRAYGLGACAKSG